MFIQIFKSKQLRKSWKCCYIYACGVQSSIGIDAAQVAATDEYDLNTNAIQQTRTQPVLPTNMQNLLYRVLLYIVERCVSL